LENQKNITILIGPEGGWSAEEENLAKSNGIKFFSLGLNTLRVETAALSALAVARESFLL
jgi:16S rRNA (uracil1498-N3)-methyltransferase